MGARHPPGHPGATTPQLQAGGVPPPQARQPRTRGAQAGREGPQTGGPPPGQQVPRLCPRGGRELKTGGATATLLARRDQSFTCKCTGRKTRRPNPAAWARAPVGRAAGHLSLARMPLPGWVIATGWRGRSCSPRRLRPKWRRHRARLPPRCRMPQSTYMQLGPPPCDPVLVHALLREGLQPSTQSLLWVHMDADGGHVRRFVGHGQTA